MSKLSLEEIENVLVQQKIEPAKVKEIVKDLTDIADQLKAEAKGPKEKWEHLIVLNDTLGEFTGKELTGWVVQQQENEDAGTVIPKLLELSAAQNEVTAKKKNRITTIADAFRVLKAKYVKEKKLRIKTKEPVRIIISRPTA